MKNLRWQSKNEIPIKVHAGNQFKTACGIPVPAEVEIVIDDVTCKSCIRVIHGLLGTGINIDEYIQAARGNYNG